MSNQEVLNYCPNFNRIINYKYNGDDLITDKLIAIYRDFIFKADLSNNEDIKMVKNIDYVLNKYTEDYLFRKEMKHEIVNIKIKKSCSDILRAIVMNILNIFDNYLFNTTRKITLAKWI